MGNFETSRRVVATPEQILAPEIQEPAKPKEKPTDSVEQDLKEAAEAAAEAAKPKPKGFEKRYVKNVNPREIIRFKDGSSFTFPGSLYVCKDEELAKKIDEVATQFGIVLQ